MSTVGTIAKMNVMLGMDNSGFTSGVEQAKASAESLSQKMKAVGTMMSVAVTTPIVGVAAAAIKSAGDFEQSMNVMAQVSGATADQMATLQAQALNLGAVTSFSAGEAADAQLELAKAGLSVNDIIAATPGVLDMAAAGGLGLAQSAEIAANALNSFNLPATEVGTVANMLAAAANASSVDVTDLADAMKMSGAVFASNKQPMDDMVAALAMLGNAGIKGSDAGTGLKTMLLSLAAPTKDAAGELSKMGLEVYNADGSMRGFSDILNDLSNSTKTMSDSQRNAALSTIFGSDAIRVATILARDYGESWDDITDALGDGSAASNVANSRMKGVAGAIEYLKGSIDSFLIGAALPYLNTIGDWIRQGADLLTMVGSLPKPILDMAVAFGAVLAAAGPLMVALSGLGAVIGFLTAPIGIVIIAVGALVAVFTTDFMGIRTSVVELSKSLWEMSGIDIGAIIDAFASFGNYIQAVLEDGDYLNDWITHLPDALQPAVAALGEFISIVMGSGTVWDKLQSIRDMFSEMLTSVTQIDWGGLWDAFQTWVDTWAKNVAASLSQFDWEGTVGTATSTFDSLKTAVVGAITSLDWVGALSAAGDVYANYVTFVVDKLKTIDWVGAITTAGDIYAAYWGAVIGALQTIDWGGHLTAAGDFLMGLWSAVLAKIQTIDWAGIIGGAGDFLATLKTGVVTAIQTIDWGTAMQTGKDWLETLRQMVVNKITLIDWAGALTNAGDFLLSLKEKVVAQIQALDWAGALEAATDLFKPLVDTVTAKMQGIDWGTAMQTGKDWLETLRQMVVNKIMLIDWAGALTTAGDFLVGLKEKVVAQIQAIDWAGALEAATDLFKPLVDTVTAKMQAIDWGGGATSLTDVFTGMRDTMLTNMTTALSEFSFTDAITNFNANLTTAINDVDWAVVGQAIRDSFVAFITAPAFLALWTIDSKNWSSFATTVKSSISTIDWGEIGASFGPLKDAIGKALGEFASGLTKGFSTPEWLADFLAWKWPDPTQLLEWKWPDLTDLLNWDWPSLPSWEWPEIGMPDWVNNLLSWNPFGGPKAEGGAVKAGTTYTVGERGTELFTPNRSGTIIPSHELNAWMSEHVQGQSSGGPMIGVANIYNELDVRDVAYQVATYQQRWK